jgi:hypothetical protein
MSLYEQYYSDTNKSHMSSIIHKLLSHELEGRPVDVPFFHQTFHQMYPLVFQKSQGDTLITLNKELVDAVGPLILAHHTRTTIEPSLHRTSGRPGMTPLKSPVLSPVETMVKASERITRKRFSCVSGDREEGSSHRYEYTLHLPEEVRSFRFEELVLPGEPSPLCGCPDIHLKLSTGGETYELLLTLVETTLVGSHSYRTYTSNDPPLMVTDDSRIRIVLLTPGGPCLPSTEDTCECRGKHIIYNDRRYFCISLKDYLWHADRNPRCEEGDTLSVSSAHATEVTTIHARHGKYLMCAPVSTAHDTTMDSLTMRNLSCQNRLRFISEDI